jgi:cellulose synthase/poly-beta-1,6-N-acetylglucosamine synthase-like glycosyltransferase
MIIVSVAIFLLLLYALLIAYYYRSWKKLEVPDLDDSIEPNGTLSVLVPARNEEKNLPHLVSALKNQSLPAHLFEVLVIDDYSTDNTVQVIHQQAAVNIRVISPIADASHSSKKKAIESGVLSARGEMIVTTDADCIPGPQWLETIYSFGQQKNASFIAAPVAFTTDGSILENFQALDFLTLQGITAASVQAGFHDMCNGANLAYRKEAFSAVNGFEGIDQVATGDDMLLMYKIRKKFPKQVFYLKHPDAIVYTSPMESWSAFFMQRKRWASKSLVYEDFRIIAVLGFIYLLNCWWMVLLVASFFNLVYLYSVLGFLLTKALIEYPFVRSVAIFYRMEKLAPWLFIFQPLHILYTVIIGLVSQIGQYEWKGRRTK